MLWFLVDDIVILSSGLLTGCSDVREFSVPFFEPGVYIDYLLWCIIVAILGPLFSGWFELNVPRPVTTILLLEIDLPRPGLSPVAID
jgi:hypothetical protein